MLCQVITSSLSATEFKRCIEKTNFIIKLFTLKAIISQSGLGCCGLTYTVLLPYWVCRYGNYPSKSCFQNDKQAVVLFLAADRSFTASLFLGTYQHSIYFCLQ